MVLMLANEVRQVWVASMEGATALKVRGLGLRHHAENLKTGRLFDLRKAFDTEDEANAASKALIVGQIAEFEASIEEMQGEIALLRATLEDMR